jgi:hypothetical protein
LYFSPKFENASVMNYQELKVSIKNIPVFVFTTFDSSEKGYVDEQVLRSNKIYF